TATSFSLGSNRLFTPQFLSCSVGKDNEGAKIGEVKFIEGEAVFKKSSRKLNAMITTLQDEQFVSYIQ
ncbi:hypothetical protein, partial [Roseibacillus ishigakijimensis]|uniref:hypothetical protein n=1 Tax=Roseibacillus ishigakijimensis TaxID=454146 RepID=UPI003626F2B0